MIDKLKSNLGEAWSSLLLDEFRQEYMQNLRKFLVQEMQNHIIYPKPDEIFQAFKLCPPSKIKIVILGQDPYHGPNQAHGLSFSVKSGVDKPPSLLNIFKEIKRDLNASILQDGDLSPWALQGVFLLNTVLSVRASFANSHAGKGWEIFTDKVIRLIDEHCSNVVFMLWGNAARQKASMINSSKHLILESVHPSPLSAYRGFIGCGHFSRANEYLEAHALSKINW